MNNKQLLKQISNPSAEYRPIPFWFINHFIRPDELRRQIREMAEKGLGGFMFHGRDGLRSKYLENEWEQGLCAAKEEADLLGLHVWLYDENGYPSGIAGGKVFEKYPDRFMKSLVVDRELTVEPGCNINLTISGDIRYVLSFPDSDKTASSQDLLPLAEEDRLKWTNSDCMPVRVLVLREDNYHPGPGNYFEYYPDYLDPEVSGEFINRTHVWYRKKFGCDYGRLIKGIFTDNACANFGHIRRAIPWSRNWAQRFQKSTGCDIRNILPGLFYRVPGYRENRLLFWRFLKDEFLNSYITAILKHCNKSGIYSTGHYCLEDGLSEHIRQIGDYFQLMKNESLTAVDQLGPEKGGSLFGNIHGEDVTTNIKNTVSSAALYGSPRIMCESFGLASGWDFDMQELRRISGYLAALGIDLFVPHGFYYSIAGNRKYECIPDHFHNPMWKYYRQWTDWISRLCWLTAGSDSLAEVAVLHPTTTLQAYIELGTPSGKSNNSDYGEVCNQVDSIFRNVVETLVRNYINCEIIPEEALQRSVLEKSTLKIPTRRSGPWRIKVLILPCTIVLEQKTINVMSAFIHNGGKVVCVGQPPETGYDVKSRRLIPLTVDILSELSAKWTVFDYTDSQQNDNDRLICWLKDNVPKLFDIKGHNGRLISRVWEKEGCRFYLLHNCTTKQINNISLNFYDSHDPILLDLDNPGFIKTDGIRKTNWFSCRVDLSPANTLLWVTGKDIKSDSEIVRLQKSSSFSHSMKIKNVWQFSTATPNLLPLRNGRITYEEEKYQCDFEFFVKGKISGVRLLVDAEMTRAELIYDGYNSDLCIILNGKSITLPSPGHLLDRWIFETDISSAIKSGENHLKIQRGSIFLTQGRMWNPYLSGDFVVIEKTGKLILRTPPGRLSTGDCAKQGYPFYAGEYRYKQTIHLPEDCRGRSVWLELGEVFNAAEVLVNGKSLGGCILPPWRYELPESTKENTFNLEIRVINTPQNLYGKKRVKSGLIGPVKILW